jgi:Domain of unknown function (DUF1906)/LysM domain
MALHGLDSAVPPAATKAKEMLDEIGGGKWWNVYIGGPEASFTWQPEHMHAYQQQGIHHFLLCYVGRQSGHVSRLTTSQGGQDGDDACQRVKDFGLAEAGTPVCLDLELRTFEAAPSASLDYAGAWCAAVRAAGLRPGVYANPGPLQALHERAAKPDWVWIASWVQHTPAADSNPHEATGVPDDQWPQHGQRAWQYAGQIGNHACQVGGVDVDIDVADAACLVDTSGHPPPPPPPPPHGHTYTVQPGDHLASIARKLGIAGGWQALYGLNRAVIGPDPDVLRPGEVLRLP